MPRPAVALDAVEGAVARGPGWQATGAEPWLRLDAKPTPGAWMRLEYASGLLDPLARPALRFFGRDLIQDELLPAAMLGRAIWMGRLPQGVSEIWVSPALQAGPFAFRVERWEPMSAARALSHFRPNRASRAARYLYGQMRGWSEFARLQSRRALGATPLAEYDAWRRARVRPFEPAFDGHVAAAAARFRVLAPDGDAAEGLQASLAAQTFAHWTLGVGDDPGALEEGDYVLRLGAGDRLEPQALAALAAAADRAGAPDALYADEDALDPSGRRFAPRLKPDWSPLFSASGYAGQPLALSAAAFRAGGLDPAARVAHVRRILLSRAEPAPVAPAPAAAPPSERRRVSIVIPTRDQPDMLRACVESLTRFPAGADFEMIVLDNGSVRTDALAYLESLSRNSDVRVARRPGPFNYSALCNFGARQARYPLLLFLNDDVEALGPDWLGRLLAFAAMPGVGAVGAKLFFPDGRLQHGGVVLGLDGFAGHVQRATGADDPGYLGGLAWPRETAAVTGACLAVEARKFFEVGGFDEARLPIEYNDIDLCLRLSEAGYACVFEPRAKLLHRESASRGSNPRLDARYAAEHAYFRERWARRLRDDPYFHPALSLDALEIALG